VANHRKQSLLRDFGLSDDMVRIHPDDDGDADAYGVTVLGSYLGYSDYVNQKLDTKASELNDICKSITTVNSKQIQFLMLRWCFSQMLIYWQRILPYRLMSRIIPQFMAMKQLILESIVEMPVDEARFKLAQLHLADSGLGLFDSGLTSHAAYVASFVESLCDFINHNHSHLSRRDDQLPCFQDFQASLTELVKYDPSITLTSLKAIVEKGAAEKLQHQLCQIFRKSNRLEVMQLFPDNRAQVFLHSTCDDVAGKILEMAPKTNMHRITNHAFMAYLRMRLFMPQVPSCTCLCRNQVDKEGFHWRGGCPHGGVRTNTHNEVVSMVKTILLYSGCYTRIEEAHMFHDGKKGDLTIRGLDGYPQPVVLDVRITSAVPANGAEISDRNANDPTYPDKFLDQHAREKVRKYGPEASTAGLAFVPLVIDTSGRMHKDFKKILETALKSASVVRCIPLSILKHYWYSALLFTLQKAQSRGMEVLKHKVLGRQLTETFETSDSTVSRSSFVVSV
jgi:hypothetical protein